MAQAQKKTAVRKRRERKNIEHGSAHICSSFNNTIVTIADLNGNTISWASAGELGYRTLHLFLITAADRPREDVFNHNTEEL